MARAFRPPKRLSDEERLEILRGGAAGESAEAIAERLGRHVRTVFRVLERSGWLGSRARPRSPLRLSVAEREEISRGLQAGESLRSIARRLGRAPSTISREVRANGGRRHYRAWRGEKRAVHQARRPRPAKLAACPRLRVEVERGLRLRWSPQQISANLKVDFPDDPEMRVSHEAIYQSLYVQGRGALRKELTSYLRTRRTHRRPRTAGTSNEGRIRDMVLISERPAEIEDRAVPGHWEGDLLIGGGGHSAIVTLVERHTRYVMLARLPNGRSAPEVRDALARLITKLPLELRRSLTWDQGKELAEHARFTIDTGVAVYFCDPHSPWQRGTNENTNGLLRQYFPKGEDLAGYSQSDLNAVARELNGRPRQTLGWMKPSQKFNELIVAMTA